MTSWEKLLRTLGFTESESKLYLISLESGPATIQDLAKKAKISRVTAYASVDALMRNGLMSTLQQGKKRMFSAESPERLIAFVHTRVRHMETTLKEVEASVDELRLLQRGEKPVVKLFTGKEGIKAIQADMLATAPKALDEFGNMDELFRLYPTEEHRQFFTDFDKLKPKRRLVFYTDKSELRKGFPDEHIADVKELKSHPLYGDVMVYGNRVALSTLRGELIYILIESQDLADTFRLMFDHIWRDVQDKRIC